MKRIGFIIGSLLVSLAVSAQNEVDALRYSQNYFGGTARSVSMAGAFCALGGDASTLSTNPSGIGVYRKSEFTFTPTINVRNTGTNYLNSSYEDTKYRFTFDNLGFVFTFNGPGEWESVNFGYAYNRLNDFNQNTVMSGVMNAQNAAIPSSLLDNFTYEANNSSEGIDFYEGLAMDAYFLPYDTVTSQYWNDFNNDGYGQTQRRVIKSEGGIGESAITLGGNYSDILYIGATLGFQKVNFSSTTTHTETDFQNTINYVDHFIFTENLLTWGWGVNFIMGFIVKPVEFLRVGGSFHIPTFYSLQDEYHNSFEGGFDDGGPNEFHRSPLGNYEYKLRTPFKANAGIAFQLEKIALFSVDYEFIDYSNAKLESNDYDFPDENETIQKIYRATHNVKGGAEVRFGPLSVRGGAAFYDSPYVSKELNEDAFTMFYTGGVGLRSDDFFIDFAYVYGTHIENQYLYKLPDAASIETAELNSTYNKYMVTLGFRF